MRLNITRTQHLGVVAASVALVITMSGCSAISGGTTTSPSKTSNSQRAVKTITYVNPRPSYPAFNTAWSCIQTQAKKYGWTSKEVGTPGTAVDNQSAVNLISQATASGTDGLIVVPLVDSLFAPVIKQARTKGIYVVGINSGDPTTGQQAAVGTDNTQMGTVMADGLGKKDPAAHVAFLSVSAATASQQKQISGFEQEAKAKYPNMVIVTSVYDNGDATQDADLVNNTLAAHPDITAIFALNGSAISATVTAVKESGRAGKVLVLGLDLNATNQQLIESGALYAVGDQGWCAMGTQSVKTIKELADGKTVDFTQPTKSTFITKDTLPAS